MNLSSIIEELDIFNSTHIPSENLLSLDDEIYTFCVSEHAREDTTGRKLIWEHVRQLNDDLIEQYLRL